MTDGHDETLPGSNDALHEDDARILDHLAAQGWDPDSLEALPPSDRARADRLVAMLGLLDRYPVEAGDDALVDAAMLRIDRDERAQEQRMRLTPVSDARPRRRIPLPDFITAASILLIAGAIAWPLLSHLRERSIDQQCRDNLRQVGEAMAMYGRDFNYALPVMHAGVAWDNSRYTDNLKPLVEGGYCEHGHLNCPGHHDVAGEPSSGLLCTYSYQWHVPAAGEAMSESFVLLGDRNPLVDAFRNRERASIYSASVSHGGRGQFVLLNSGATIWLESPWMKDNDNIWLPHGAFELEADSRTDSLDDSFLVH